MNKKDLKKITIGSLAAIAAIATPIATVISCGKDDKKTENKKPSKEANNKKPGDKPENKKPSKEANNKKPGDKPENKKLSNNKSGLVKHELTSKLNAVDKGKYSNLDEYKEALKQLFKDAYSNGNNDKFDENDFKAITNANTDTEALEAAKGLPIFSKKQPGEKLTISIPTIKSGQTLQVYKDSILSLFKGKFNANGGAINLNKIINAANDAAVKNEADVLAGNVYEAPKLGKEIKNNINFGAPFGLETYKNGLKNIFKNFLNKNGGALDLSTIDSAQTKDGALKAANKIEAYGKAATSYSAQAIYF